MESERFDALSRHVGGEGSRRGILRVGFGVLAASAAGVLGLGEFGETEAKKVRAQRKKVRKQKAREEKKKKAKQGPEGPAGPAGPAGLAGQPGPAATPVTCPAGQSATCGDGCCSTSLRPKCCDNAFETSGKSCHASTDLCCPAAFGGGSCRPGEECCPLRYDGSRGRTCLEPDDPDELFFCCGVGSGGACVKADEKCCAPNLTNDANNGCCSDDRECCNPNTVCPNGELCSEIGCCDAI